MKDKEMDEILEQAAQTPHRVDPAVLDRVSASIAASLRPVHPLPPSWVLEGSVAAIALAIAIAGAARAGFYGIEKLGTAERALIFPALGVFLWLAAAAWVAENIPGSRRRVSSFVLFLVGTLTMLAIFAGLFRDYRSDHFVSAGIACLVTGLLHAIPAALLGWLVLRRGFAVDSAAAGLAAGTLAGLAGVAMLELHCPNFQAMHILIWHTAVLPVSAAAGALLAWRLSFRTSS
jgi:hypothetical protein